MSGPRLTREEQLARWSQLHGGYDTSQSRLVSGWLRGVAVIAAPLATAGVPASALTSASVAAAGGAALVARSLPWLAGVLVLLSAYGDGLDGAVAVMTGTESRFGALVDAIGDRCADLLFVLALWQAGAPAGWALAAGVSGTLLEYVRARAGGLGAAEIGLVTVGERPMRVAAVATGLLLAELSFAPGVAAAAVAVLAAAGVIQLGVDLRRRLLDAPG